MSTSSNITFKKVIDSVQSASVLQDSVHTANLGNMLESNIKVLAGATSGSAATPTVTTAQLRQAMTSQLVVYSAGAGTTNLLIDGNTSASDAADLALQLALGLYTAGDSAILYIQRSGDTTAAVSLNGVSIIAAAKRIGVVVVQCTTVGTANTIVAINEA